MTKTKMYQTTNMSSPATTEERSEAGVAGELGPPDPEVRAKAKRRRFTAEYKLRILEEIDRAGPGQGGAILRREGLYSSLLTVWRRARRQGSLTTLSARRGPKPKRQANEAKAIAKLERQLARTKEELRKAHLILDVQGKVAELLGFSLKDGTDS
jgi:transposase-like protein